MALWVKTKKSMLCVEAFDSGVATITGFAGSSVKDLIGASMECLGDPAFEQVIHESFNNSAPVTTIRFEANGAYCIVPCAERNPAFIYQNWLKAVQNH